MNTLYFPGPARTAALHLLDSPFGERLRDVATVTDTDERLLVIEFSDGLPLSSGEFILVDVLNALAGQGGIWLSDLNRVDDAHWDRVIAALFMLRGRTLEAVVSR